MWQNYREISAKIDFCFTLLLSDFELLSGRLS